MQIQLYESDTIILHAKRWGLGKNGKATTKWGPSISSFTGSSISTFTHAVLPLFTTPLLLCFSFLYIFFESLKINTSTNLFFLIIKI